ncbi:hypothetical protein [Serratia marcescens]|uniref:hypothetical protein n=1 Tax=Serratia marcescens TaxID=615 RepID=UPI0027E3B7C5|nr:hypothetical protein [Serratia marcescens]MDH2270139.1 hypothetical protein [Serratia marcescens]MDH2278116.1 hypothetical protein [Serratia marcescens]
MIDIINAAEKIRAENATFGYEAGKLEIANDIWNGCLNPSERLEVMNATKLEGLSTLEKLRACVKTLAEMF